MKVLIFLSVLALGAAVIQEIILHESNNGDHDGNFYTFRRGIPDVTIYPFAKDIVRYCQKSRVTFYSGINYTGSIYNNFEGQLCYAFDSGLLKSARFHGNSNTTMDGVSLYPETNLRGDEIHVDRSPFAGITQNVSSLGYTGGSAWTVFEGINFNGKSACLKPATYISDSSYYYNITRDLNVTTIGSLFKGCVTHVTPEKRRQLLEGAFKN